MERATLEAKRARVFRPTRSKGQCFLRDEQVIERIADAIAPAEGETLLEIGGGHGELSRPLVRRGAKVVSIEADKRLAPELSTIEGIDVVPEDALKVDYDRVLDERGLERVRVCGNLPYSVASPILLRLLTSRRRFDELTLMFQDEVASRLTARPGTKAYGFLTVMAQQAAHVRVLFRISREAFRPRPRVVSALVRFQMHSAGEAPAIGDEATFRALVHALLAHRRKTIANNIKQLQQGVISREAVTEALERLDIDPKRRAETLPVETFAEISRIIASLA